MPDANGARRKGLMLLMPHFLQLLLLPPVLLLVFVPLLLLLMLILLLLLQLTAPVMARGLLVMIRQSLLVLRLQ